MKLLFTTVILSLITITHSCVSSGDNKTSIEDVKEIRQCFQIYKSHALNAEGEKALKYVSKPTIKYYDLMLEYTLYSDSTEVSKLGLLDKLMVFIMRHQVDETTLLSFNGEKLFAYAIDEGMIGNEGLSKQSIGEIKIEDKDGYGSTIINGESTPFKIHFSKEEGKWKIDLTSLFEVGESAFKQVIEEGGIDENDYIFMMLEILTGEYPSNDIWHPIN